MNHGDVSRRKFLVATIAYSGLISTGMGTALFRASSAWAQSSVGSADELTQMARLLFPHDDIADDVYAEVVNGILSDAASDSSLSDTLATAVNALNAAQDAEWFDIVAEKQIAAIQSVETEPFFVAIQSGVRNRFYNHPKVWDHIGYPGSSVEHGGYVDRGFDDIDWLPGDA